MKILKQEIYSITNKFMWMNERTNKWTNINHFHANVPFLYPLNAKCFLTFSGGRKIGRLREKGFNVWMNGIFIYPEKANPK